MICFAATAHGESVEDSCVALGRSPPRNAAPGIASKNKSSASKLIVTRHLLRMGAPIHYMTGWVCKSLAEQLESPPQLLYRRTWRGWERRGMMRHEKPLLVAAQKDIRRLHHGIVETVRKRGRHVLRAGNPADVALDAHPNAAQRDSHAL